MQYIKLENRSEMSWMQEHWETPLTSLGDHVQMWTMHSLRALNEGNAERASTAFWQIGDAADVYHTRLSDMKSGKSAEQLGMTAEQLKTVHDYFSAPMTQETEKKLQIALTRWQDAGVPESVLNDCMGDEGHEHPSTAPALTEIKAERLIYDLGAYDLSDPANPRIK